MHQCWNCVHFHFKLYITTSRWDAFQIEKGTQVTKEHLVQAIYKAENVQMIYGLRLKFFSSILGPARSTFLFPLTSFYPWLKLSSTAPAASLWLASDNAALSTWPGWRCAEKSCLRALQLSKRPFQSFSRQCRAAAASPLISGELQAQGNSWGWSTLSPRYRRPQRQCLLPSSAAVLKD